MTPEQQAKADECRDLATHQDELALLALKSDDEAYGERLSKDHEVWAAILKARAIRHEGGSVIMHRTDLEIAFENDPEGLMRYKEATKGNPGVRLLREQFGTPGMGPTDPSDYGDK